MFFTTFENEKKPFQAMKTGSLKSRKIAIFPNGLTHGFGSKLASFLTSFFRQYRPEKCVLRYSSTKKTPFQAIKKEVEKVKKLPFF